MKQQIVLRDVWVIPIVITESSVTSTSTIIIIYEEGNTLKINRGINFCTVDNKKIIVNVADVINWHKSSMEWGEAQFYCNGKQYNYW